MIVVDAGVLIAHLDASDAHHERATELLLAAVDEQLAASPLTLAEVLVGPARAGRMTAAQAAIDDLQIQAVPFDNDAPGRLATLRAQTKLRLPDCCVLLAADITRAAVATFDLRLADAATQLGLVPFSSTS